MMVEDYGGQHTKLGLVFIVGILAVRMSLCTGKLYYPVEIE